MRAHWAVVGMLVAGCQPRTELMIGIATDIRAPDILDAVQLNVTRTQDGMPEEQLPPWTITGIPDQPFNLPGSYGVYSDGSEVKIEIDLTGLKNDNPVVLRRAILGLVDGKTLFVRMGLVVGCMNKNDCTGTQTCVEGVCKDLEIDPTTLPDFDDSLVTTLTCNSGTNYLNTADNTPMPLSADANNCPGAMCGEGTCYKPPSCSPDGTYQVTANCPASCPNQQGGTLVVSGNGSEFNVTNGDGSQSPQPCTVSLDTTTCGGPFQCGEGNGNGTVQWTANGGTGTLVPGGSCDATCTINLTKTNSGSGGGTVPTPDAGALSCVRAGLYQVTYNCDAAGLACEMNGYPGMSNSFTIDATGDGDFVANPTTGIDGSCMSTLSGCMSNFNCNITTGATGNATGSIQWEGNSGTGMVQYNLKTPHTCTITCTMALTMAAN